MTNCPDCRRVLEPATLNAKHQWCSVCAMEFDENGNKCESHLAPPPAMETALPESAAAPAAAVSITHREAPMTASTRRFRVKVGQVSFEMLDNATLDIAGTKVVITAL